MKITQRALSKYVDIIEILMEVLGCSYTQAYNIVKDTSTFRVLNEEDGATLYQSAPCCVEDIRKKLALKDAKYKSEFTQESINNTIDRIKERNSNKENQN